MWEDVQVYYKVPAPLKIDIPPCHKCRYWYPTQKVTIKGYGPDVELVLCHSENMYHDFSCFTPKAQKD